MPIGVIKLARAARASGKDALDHIRIGQGKNGGFNVQHFGGDFSESPQNFNFGANEGQGMLDHVASTFGIQGAGGKTRPPASPPRPGKNPRGSRGMMASSNRSSFGS